MPEPGHIRMVSNALPAKPASLSVESFGYNSNQAPVPLPQVMGSPYVEEQKKKKLTKLLTRERERYRNLFAVITHNRQYRKIMAGCQ